MNGYGRIVFEGGQTEIVEKKSRFLAETAATAGEEEVTAFVESVRKKTWDARHHCFACVLGEQNEFTRCSDDGEPSGTAGRPILDVLLTSGIRNACIVVTRYFGGVLLGTGGLVRAYGRAAREGLAASVILEKMPGRKLQLSCEYAGLGRIRFLADRAGGSLLAEEYTDRAALTYLLPDGESGRFVHSVADATGGRAAVMDLGEVPYAVREGEVILL